MDKLAKLYFKDVIDTKTHILDWLVTSLEDLVANKKDHMQSFNVSEDCLFEILREIKRYNPDAVECIRVVRWKYGYRISVSMPSKYMATDDIEFAVDFIEKYQNRHSIEPEKEQ
ncbi:MAG: hypothetical protein AB7P49_00110 [Bdellovibrionales bacterium]